MVINKKKKKIIPAFCYIAICLLFGFLLGCTCSHSHKKCESSKCCQPPAPEPVKPFTGAVGPAQ